jgi:flagellar hook assembly protein FlgD
VTGGKVGDQTFAWDGRNMDGQIVPPGIYLCRIEVQADNGDSQQTHLVHVAY